MVSPTSLPGAEAGVPYAQALGASAGTAPFRFAVTSGTLPAGLSLSTSGTLSGTPAQVGEFAFTVTATDAGGCSGGAACSLAVTCPAIALVPPLLPDGVVGLAYSQAITATAGVAPLRFSLTAGALPAGLTLSTAGLLSGTPAAAGTAVFTVGATDTAGCTASADYVLDVYATTPVSSVAASTAGLCISTANPCVSVPVEYTRGESVPARGLKVAFAIDPSMLALCTPDTPAASIRAGTWFGDLANRQLLVTDNGGGSYTVDAVLLGEPCGITTGGVLFTVDLRSVADDGEGAITVGLAKARDCANVAIPVMPGPPAALRIMNTPIPIAPATLPAALAGRVYEQALTAETGEAPFTFSLAAGALPPGLALSPAGVISGTPLATGAFTFTVQVADAAGCPGSRAYTLDVGCPAIGVLPPALPEAVVGVPYGGTLTADGGIAPLSWASRAGSLPAGLTLDPATRRDRRHPRPRPASPSSPSPPPTRPGARGRGELHAARLRHALRVQRRAEHGRPVPLGRPTVRERAGACTPARDSTPARGASVTFEIDPAMLSLCTPAAPASSIHAGTWLAGFADTDFQVTDHGGGRYTVDQAILGTPCGVTGGGVLFTVDLAAGRRRRRAAPSR